MRLRLGLTTTIAAVVAIVCAATIAPSATAAPPAPNANLPIPITGTLPVLGGTFTGTFNLERFAAQNGQLVAIGTLTGTLKNAAGEVIGTVTDRPITLPFAQGTGSCQILDLTLGPLDLNLLGLVVHLDRVHLNITAVPGPGNLLGNLLCAVAHLLDSNASAQALAVHLNRILGRL